MRCLKIFCQCEHVASLSFALIATVYICVAQTKKSPQLLVPRVRDVCDVCNDDEGAVNYKSKFILCVGLIRLDLPAHSTLRILHLSNIISQHMDTNKVFGKQ